MSKKKQQTKNVPELRFPEFGGEWEEKKLNDLGKYKKSYTFSRAKEGSGKYKHVHYGDIHTKLPSIIKEASILPSITEEKNFSVVEKGDLIFADASEDYEDLGKATMVDFDDTNVISGLHTHLFRPNENIIPHFLIYYTETQRYKRHIKREGNGISVLGISKTNLGKLLTFLPSIQEQQKIGDFFSKLDRQIELEEKKLALFEEQKKGYMQKIFSQELRFKDESGNEYHEWEEAKIKELFQSVTDKEHSGDLDVLSASQSQGMILRENSNRDISYNRKNLLNYKKTIPGDFIISLRSFEGGLEYNTLTGLVSPAYTVLRKVTNEIDNDYFKYYFKKESFINRLDSMIYGIRDGKTISFKEFSTFKIQLPRLNEQRKIGMFLNELDKSIKSLQQKIEFLKLRKKTLVQRVMV
ncbi:restriction endonuclease subunit S [Staphylococcus simulans]|uniref:restriction endonuclease subunit S n=1 Tax=Staphylococcus simulans TaxID=1286 RepID=UPI000E69AF68|nr:restriction endonuclease subunit S [Staphylococcus simulans]RIN77077.1 restriction endonuclease subunit S [Staphylococcus simulans]